METPGILQGFIVLNTQVENYCAENLPYTKALQNVE